MSHLSLKIYLNGMPVQDLISDIDQKVGLETIREACTETDKIFHIHPSSLRESGAQSLFIKVRQKSHDDPEWIVLEKVNGGSVGAETENAMRLSYVCVLNPTNLSMESSTLGLMGKPDCVVRKNRQIFKCKKYNGVRFYIDTLHLDDGDDLYMEIQLPSTNDAINDQMKMEALVAELGLSDRPVTNYSYMQLIAMQYLPNEPHDDLVKIAQRIPVHMLKQMAAFDVVRFHEPARLLTAGECVEHGSSQDCAYLILEGQANILGKDIVLGPGRFLGFFGLMEGFRVSDVQFQGTALVLPGDFARELLRLPFMATDYIEWKTRSFEACSMRRKMVASKLPGRPTPS